VNYATLASQNSACTAVVQCAIGSSDLQQNSQNQVASCGGKLK